MASATTPAAQAIHTARVLLNEARARRNGCGGDAFYWRLLAWAANARRRAATPCEPPSARRETTDMLLQMEIRFNDKPTA